MDHNSLQRLAREGIAAFPPLNLPDLTAWCWDWGETTGDARYCSLSRSIQMVCEIFEPDGAVSSDLVDDLDALLSVRLDDILTAQSPEVGSLLARSLRESLHIVIAEHI